MKKLLFIVIGVSGAIAATAQKQVLQPKNRATTDTTIQVEIRPTYTLYSEEPFVMCQTAEQILLKEEYRVGSTFRAVTTKRFVGGGYESYQCTPPEWEYYDKQIIVKQPCNGKPKTVTIAAKRIKKPSTYTVVNIPTKYVSINVVVVDKMGEGELIPAEYRTVTKPLSGQIVELRTKVIPAEYKTVVVQKCKGE